MQATEGEVLQTQERLEIADIFLMYANKCWIHEKEVQATMNLKNLS